MQHLILRNSASLMSNHQGTTKNLCLSYWDGAALDQSAVEHMLRAAAPEHVAFSAASFSGTPVQQVRSVLERLAHAEKRVA